MDKNLNQAALEYHRLPKPGKIEVIPKLVTSGAGAAALACLDMLVALGVKMENITVTDIVGVVYKGRAEQMDPNKARYAKKTSA